jgi:hypothetical protein
LGCQNLLWWRKKEIKPEKMPVSAQNDDAEFLSGFRNPDTIAPIPKKKEKEKNFFWSDSQKKEIERHLGITEN